MNADELTALVRRRIESRYQRICFVYGELEKIGGARKAVEKSPALPAGGKSPGADKSAAFKGSFEDFVFGTIDFSAYQKIDADEFTLLFDDGLFDFDEAFYRKAFNASRETVGKTISRSYIRVGPFMVCKKPNPLILSIMRSVHTSLEFAPLFTPADLDDAAGEERFRSLVAALDGVVIRHGDGMETKLFRPENPSAQANDGAPAKTAAGLPALLCGTFHPQGKAHTITLIPAAAGNPAERLDTLKNPG